MVIQIKVAMMILIMLISMMRMTMFRMKMITTQQISNKYSILVPKEKRPKTVEPTLNGVITGCDLSYLCVCVCVCVIRMRMITTQYKVLKKMYINITNRNLLL